MTETLNDIKKLLDTVPYLRKLKLIEGEEPLCWDIVTDPGYAPIAANMDLMVAEMFLRSAQWFDYLIITIESLQKENDLLYELTGNELLLLMDGSLENVERMTLKEMLGNKAVIEKFNNIAR